MIFIKDKDKNQNTRDLTEEGERGLPSAFSAITENYYNDSVITN